MNNKPQTQIHDSPLADRLALARWRLVLGRFAESGLPGALNGGAGQYQAMDDVLEYLYAREYGGRGVRPEGAMDVRDRTGGLGPSVLTIPTWLAKVRELFPRETIEVIQRHAIDRYKMKELVTDPQFLRAMEPNYELLKTILTFKDMMRGEVLDLARQIVRQIVEEIRQRLARQVRQALWGKLNRNQHSRLKVFRNLDVRRTIRDNLKHFDTRRRQLVLENLHFFSRVRHHMPWHIIIAVDCSGSMIDSVIHSAIMAGIFKGLPALRVSLMAFDTSVVDLSDQVEDPTQLLLSVQLGGGTDIAEALLWCEGQVSSPSRTIVVLVTDFEEGGPSAPLVAGVKRLREAGARVLGLAALDPEATPCYNHQIAQQCADAGAEIAALTPGRLAEWLAQVIS